MGVNRYVGVRKPLTGGKPDKKALICKWALKLDSGAIEEGHVVRWVLFQRDGIIRVRKAVEVMHPCLMPILYKAMGTIN